MVRTEDDVSTVEPGSHNRGDEELGAVGVLAGVSHRENTGLRVLELEVLIYGNDVYIGNTRDKSEQTHQRTSRRRSTFRRYL